MTASLSSGQTTAQAVQRPAGVVLRGDRNQCPACDLLFNSSHAFDKHRTGRFGIDRRCMTADEMLARGMIQGKDHFWRGSAMPDSLHVAEVQPE